MTEKHLIPVPSNILSRTVKPYHHSPITLSSHCHDHRAFHHKNLPLYIKHKDSTTGRYAIISLQIPHTWSFAATDTMAILPTISTQPDPRASSSLVPALSPRSPLRNHTRWSLVTAHTAFVPTETWANFKSSGAPTSNQNSPANSSYGKDK